MIQKRLHSYILVMVKHLSLDALVGLKIGRVIGISKGTLMFALDTETII